MDGELVFGRGLICQKWGYSRHLIPPVSSWRHVDVKTEALLALTDTVCEEISCKLSVPSPHNGVPLSPHCHKMDKPPKDIAHQLMLNPAESIPSDKRCFIVLFTQNHACRLAGC